MASNKRSSTVVTGAGKMGRSQHKLPPAAPRIPSIISSMEDEEDEAEEDLWYICLICNQAFQNEKFVRLHRKREHPTTFSRKMICFGQYDLLPTIKIQRCRHVGQETPSPFKIQINNYATDSEGNQGTIRGSNRVGNKTGKRRGRKPGSTSVVGLDSSLALPTTQGNDPAGLDSTPEEACSGKDRANCNSEISEQLQDLANPLQDDSNHSNASIYDKKRQISSKDCFKNKALVLNMQAMNPVVLLQKCSFVSREKVGSNTTEATTVLLTDEANEAVKEVMYAVNDDDSVESDPLANPSDEFFKLEGRTVNVKPELGWEEDQEEPLSNNTIETIEASTLEIVQTKSGVDYLNDEEERSNYGTTSENGLDLFDLATANYDGEPKLIEMSRKSHLILPAQWSSEAQRTEANVQLEGNLLLHESTPVIRNNEINVHPDDTNTIHIDGLEIECPEVELQDPIVSENISAFNFEILNDSFEEEATVKIEATNPNRRRILFNSVEINVISSGKDDNDEDTKTYICSICSYGSSQLKATKNHITWTHKTGSDQRKKLYSCEICYQIFVGPYKLTAHKNQAHSKKQQSTECQFCHKIFTTLWYLKRHVTHIHVNPGHKSKQNSTPDPISTASCSDKIPTNTESALQAKITEFPCTLCGKIFNRLCDRTRHVNYVHKHKDTDQGQGSQEHEVHQGTQQILGSESCEPVSRLRPRTRLRLEASYVESSNEAEESDGNDDHDDDEYGGESSAQSSMSDWNEEEITATIHGQRETRITRTPTNNKRQTKIKQISDEEYENIVECQFCPCKYHTAQHLLSHVNRTHPWTERSNINATTTTSECTISQNLNKIPLKWHKHQDLQTCGLCCKVLSNLGGMNQHVIIFHSDHVQSLSSLTTNGGDAANDCSCIFCANPFSIIEQGEQSKFQCNTCTKNFYTECDLRRHIFEIHASYEEMPPPVNDHDDDDTEKIIGAKKRQRIKRRGPYAMKAKTKKKELKEASTIQSGELFKCEIGGISCLIRECAFCPCKFRSKYLWENHVRFVHPELIARNTQNTLKVEILPAVSSSSEFLDQEANNPIPTSNAFDVASQYMDVDEDVSCSTTNKSADTVISDHSDASASQYQDPAQSTIATEDMEVTGAHSDAPAPEHPHRHSHRNVEACDICCKPFLNLKSMNQHILTFHDDHIEHLNTNSGNIESCPCPFCANSFEPINKSEDGSWKYQCKHCPSTSTVFDTECEIRRHIYEHHTEGDEEPAQTQTPIRMKYIKQLQAPLIPIKDKELERSILERYAVKVETVERMKYKCTICDKITSSSADMSNHIFANHDDHIKNQEKSVDDNDSSAAAASCACGYCIGRAFVAPEQSQVNMYECKLCPYKFVAQFTMRKHLVEVHAAKVLNKDQDGILKAKEPCDYKSRRPHSRIITDANGEVANGPQKTPRLFRCKFCACKYALREQVRAHVKKCHKDGISHFPAVDVMKDLENQNGNGETSTTQDVPEIQQNNGNNVANVAVPEGGGPKLPENKSQYSITCDICQKPFLTIPSLNGHVKRMHYQYNPLICQICSKKFPNLKALSFHVWQVHNTRRDHLCPICGLTFKPNILPSHIARMHGVEEKKFICDICERPFKMAGDLASHKKSHAPKLNTFLCPTCGKELVSEYRLRLHIEVVHTDVKRYKCPKCDSRFNQSKNLKTHMARHSEARPFKCSYCDKAFKSVANQKQHERTHLKLKHTCKICGKSYDHKPTLSRHHLDEHVSEEDKIHGCKLCGKKFLKPLHLQLHEVTHKYDGVQRGADRNKVKLTGTITEEERDATRLRNKKFRK